MGGKRKLFAVFHNEVYAINMPKLLRADHRAVNAALVGSSPNTAYGPASSIRCNLQRRHLNRALKLTLFPFVVR